MGLISLPLAPADSTREMDAATPGACMALSDPAVPGLLAFLRREVFASPSERCRWVWPRRPCWLLPDTGLNRRSSSSGFSSFGITGLLGRCFCSTRCPTRIFAQSLPSGGRPKHKETTLLIGRRGRAGVRLEMGGLWPSCLCKPEAFKLWFSFKSHLKPLWNDCGSRFSWLSWDS